MGRFPIRFRRRLAWARLALAPACGPNHSHRQFPGLVRQSFLRGIFSVADGRARFALGLELGGHRAVDAGPMVGGHSAQ